MPEKLQYFGVWSLLVQNENPMILLLYCSTKSTWLLTFQQCSVYSSCEVGKLRCFSWIKERFGGPGVQFCVIGDGPEECEAAQFMKWPFIRINLRPNGTHRFPGLTTEAISRRISTFYGIDAKNSDL